FPVAGHSRAARISGRVAVTEYRPDGPSGGDLARPGKGLAGKRIEAAVGLQLCPTGHRQPRPGFRPGRRLSASPGKEQSGAGKEKGDWLNLFWEEWNGIR